jgi:ABC-type Fe3+ transport system substrate-binding protein
MRGNLGALAVALTLAVAACGGTAAPPSSPSTTAQAAPKASSALQALIDGARKEGTLTLTYGEGTLGGAVGAQKTVAALNKAYGLDLKAQHTPGPSMPEMVGKVLQESQSGRPASTDVLVGYAETFLPGIQNGLFQPGDWQAWAPNIKDPQLVTANGSVVAVQTSIAGITINTNKLKGAAVPKTMEDLLKPELKGRLASTPYGAYFDFLGTDQLWGEAKTTDYLNKFTKQLTGLIRCNETNRVASGEFDAFAIACSQSDTLVGKKAGQPLDFIVPADAPLALYLYTAVPKNAAHPNTAKLWINQLLSRESQDILYDVNAADLHILPGSKTAKMLQDVQAANTKLTLETVDFLNEHYLPNGPANRAKFQKILASK